MGVEHLRIQAIIPFESESFQFLASSPSQHLEKIGNPHFKISKGIKDQIIFNVWEICPLDDDESFFVRRPSDELRALWICTRQEF